MHALFYDKNGDAVAIGDKVVHDKYPDSPQTVYAFRCGYISDALHVAVTLSKWTDRQPSTLLTKWKPVARPRTFHEIADIVRGRNEFTDGGNEDHSIYVGCMVRQRSNGRLTLNGLAINGWKWRPFGATEWQDLATVEE